MTARIISPRSGRQHKAWGEAKRNPGTMNARIISPRSGRQQHKAWGEAKRNPRGDDRKNHQPAERAAAQGKSAMSPRQSCGRASIRTGRQSFAEKTTWSGSLVLNAFDSSGARGFWHSRPALCCRPLRGLGSSGGRDFWRAKASSMNHSTTSTGGAQNLARRGFTRTSRLSNPEAF
jgi:hypothetical protein